MPNDNVDIMRISHNVKQNMKDKDSYAPGGVQSQTPVDEKNDFKLQDRDMELNFGEDEAEEDEENSTSTSQREGSETRGFPVGSAVTIETGIDVSSAEKEEKLIEEIKTAHPGGMPLTGIKHVNKEL